MTDNCPKCGYPVGSCDATCDFPFLLSHWISVDDELPDNEMDQVLIFHEDLHHMDINYSGDGIALADYEGGKCFRVNEDKIVRPTHWMYLPASPKVR